MILSGIHLIRQVLLSQVLLHLYRCDNCSLFYGKYSTGAIVSVFSIMTDTGVYLAALAGLLHIDNRKKYVDSVTGKRDSNRFRQDAKKMVTALGVSEIGYIVALYSHKSTYCYDQTSSNLPNCNGDNDSSWIFYIITANLMIEAQKLF
jgi:hypothetical protein